MKKNTSCLCQGVRFQFSRWSELASSPFFLPSLLWAQDARPFHPLKDQHFSGCITLLTHAEISKNKKEPGSSPSSRWDPTTLLFPSKWLYSVSISSLHSLFKPLESAFWPQRFKKFLQDLLTEKSQLYSFIDESPQLRFTLLAMADIWTQNKLWSRAARVQIPAGPLSSPPWPLSCLISQSLSSPAVTWGLWLYWSTRQVTVSTRHSILHSGSIQWSVTSFSFHSTSLPNFVPHS